MKQLQPRHFKRLYAFLWTPTGMFLQMGIASAIVVISIQLGRGTVWYAANYNLPWDDSFLSCGPGVTPEECDVFQSILSTGREYGLLSRVLYASMAVLGVVSIYCYYVDKGSFCPKTPEVLLKDLFFGFPAASIMVSYCWADGTELPRRVARYFPCRWLDIERLIPGSVVQESCRSAAQNAFFRFVFVSPAYLRSANCKVEYEEIKKHPGSVFVFIYDGTPEDEVHALIKHGHIVYYLEALDGVSRALPASFILKELITTGVLMRLLSRFSPGINNRYAATAAALVGRRNCFPLYSIFHVGVVCYVAAFLAIVAGSEFVCMSNLDRCEPYGQVNRDLLSPEGFFLCDESQTFFNDTVNNQIGILTGVCPISFTPGRIVAVVLAGVLIAFEAFLAFIQHSHIYRSWLWRFKLPDAALLLIVLRHLGITSCVPFASNVPMYKACFSELEDLDVISTRDWQEGYDDCCGSILVDTLSHRPSFKSVACGTMVFWTRSELTSLPLEFQEIFRHSLVSVGKPPLEAILCRLLMHSLSCSASSLTMGEHCFERLKMGHSQSLVIRPKVLLAKGKAMLHLGGSVATPPTKPVAASFRFADVVAKAQREHPDSEEVVACREERARMLLKCAVIRFQLRKHEQLALRRRRRRLQLRANHTPRTLDQTQALRESESDRGWLLES